MRFIQARWFTPAHGREIDLLVMHRMEAPDKPTDTAESVANYFAHTSVQASAHYCLDRDSAVQCVRDHDVAWAAPYANHDGLHFELAGYSKDDDWSTDRVVSMLERAARLLAHKAHRYRIPRVWLGPEHLRAGDRGITSHANVTAAFGPVGGHTDPGPSFPHRAFVKLVEKHYQELYGKR